jgi:hypothetical protein
MDSNLHHLAFRTANGPEMKTNNLLFFNELRNIPPAWLWQLLCTLAVLGKGSLCDSNGGSLGSKRFATMRAALEGHLDGSGPICGRLPWLALHVRTRHGAGLAAYKGISCR